MIDTAFGSSGRGGTGRIAVGLSAILIVMMWSGLCTGGIQNPSFESVSLVTGHGPCPNYWRRVDHPSFNSNCTLSWRTDGLLSAALLSRLTNYGTTYSFSPGNYQAFWQDMDLTGIGRIVFDAHLVANPPGVFEHFEAALYVGGAPLWSRRVGGICRDQEVDVSRLTGWHCVELRLTAIDSGVFGTSYWAMWDNMRLVEGVDALIPAEIDLDPDTLNLHSNGRWITCYIELKEPHDPTSINGATVKLQGIPAYMGDEGFATLEANDGNIMDHDGDGIMERMVKFDRAAVQGIVPPPEATLTVTGLVGGMSFEGSATIRVSDKGGKKQ